jgi:hypothetical protein
MNLLGDERGPSQDGEMTFSNIAGVLPAADKVIELYNLKLISITSIWRRFSFISSYLYILKYFIFYFLCLRFDI